MPWHTFLDTPYLNYLALTLLWGCFTKWASLVNVGIFMVCLADATSSAELVTLISTLSVKEPVEGDQKKRIFKVVKAIGCFTAEEYQVLREKVPNASKPLLDQLRQRANDILMVFGGGDAAERLAKVAKKVKEEALARDISLDDRDVRYHIEYVIAPNERLAVLTHAKKIVPYCSSPSAKITLLKIIQMISKGDRETALQHMPAVLTAAVDDKIKEDTLDTLNQYLGFAIVKKGDLLREVTALLPQFPWRVWQMILKSKREPFAWLEVVRKASCVLTNHEWFNHFEARDIFEAIEKNNYSAVLLHNSIPLLPFFAYRFSAIPVVLSSCAFIPEERQKTVISDCVRLLSPLGHNREYAIREIIEILQSPLAPIYEDFSKVLKPETEWHFPMFVRRVFTSNPDRHEDLKKEIKAILQEHPPTKIQHPILELESRFEKQRWDKAHLVINWV